MSSEEDDLQSGSGSGSGSGGVEADSGSGSGSEESGSGSSSAAESDTADDVKKPNRSKGKQTSSKKSHVVHSKHSGTDSRSEEQEDEDDDDDGNDNDGMQRVTIKNRKANKMKTRKKKKSSSESDAEEEEEEDDDDDNDDYVDGDNEDDDSECESDKTRGIPETRKLMTEKTRIAKKHTNVVTDEYSHKVMKTNPSRKVTSGSDGEDQADAYDDESAHNKDEDGSDVMNSVSESKRGTNLGQKKSGEKQKSYSTTSKSDYQSESRSQMSAASSTDCQTVNKMHNKLRKTGKEKSGSCIESSDVTLPDSSSEAADGNKYMKGRLHSRSNQGGSGSSNDGSCGQDAEAVSEQESVSGVDQDEENEDESGEDGDDGPLIGGPGDSDVDTLTGTECERAIEENDNDAKQKNQFRSKKENRKMQTKNKGSSQSSKSTDGSSGSKDKKQKKASPACTHSPDNSIDTARSEGQKSSAIEGSENCSSTEIVSDVTSSKSSSKTKQETSTTIADTGELESSGSSSELSDESYILQKFSSSTLSEEGEEEQKKMGRKSYPLPVKRPHKALLDCSYVNLQDWHGAGIFRVAGMSPLYWTFYLFYFFCSFFQYSIFDWHLHL